MNYFRPIIAMIMVSSIMAGEALAKKSPESESIVPKNYVRPESGALKGLANKFDSDGTTRRLYYPSFSFASENSDVVASEFLRQYSDDLGITDVNSNLKLISVQNSLSGSHYRYQQICNGISVFASEVLINIDLKGKVSSVISDYKRFSNAASSPSVTPQAARNIAISEIGVSIFRGQPETELVYYGGEDPVSLCWKVLVPAQKPLGDWQVFVDAASGAVIQKSNIMCFVDGAGYTFDPNPIVSEQNLALSDSTDRNYPALSAARFDVVLQGLDAPQGGRYYLSGPYVNTEPTSNRANEADPTAFHYDRLDDRFEEVVVYYQISTCRNFYQTLGFRTVMDYSISANVNGTTDDNSWFSPWAQEVTYGSGGVDDAEDGDVIIHEYGHATQFDQVTNWGQTHEGGSMGEGFGDYLTVAFFHPVFNNWDEARVFDWDANPVDHFWAGRRVDGNKHYPEDMDGEVHDDGEIWSRCLWDIQNGVGYDTSAQLVLESHFYLTPNADFEDGANAIVQADINLFSGSHLLQIGQAFVDRGIFQEMPVHLEIFHDPLTDTENIYGPFPVIASIVHTNPIDSVEVFYKFGSAPDFSLIEMAPTGNPDVFSANLPGPGENSEVYYYIKAIDNIGLSRKLPPGAPNQTFEFYAGPDSVAPTIEHQPLGDLPDSLWPPTVFAVVSDNIGLESVAVEFNVNGGTNVSIPLAYNETDDNWQGAFTGDVTAGDEIRYRIVAIDSSSNSNVAYFPPDDYLSFNILQMIEITYYMSDGPVLIPDIPGQSFQDTLNFAEDLEIFDVDVYMDITHSRIGDLVIRMWSPDNTRLVLHNRDGGNNDNIIGWYGQDLVPFDTLGMEIYNGRSSAGNWRLFVADMVAGEQGLLHQWGIRIMGAGEPLGTKDDIENAPRLFALDQNYPNPFNPSTNISFDLPQPGLVKLEIFDLLGRQIATPLDGRLDAGEHTVVWDGKSSSGQQVSSGIYFARLTSNDKSDIIRMTLLK